MPNIRQSSETDFVYDELKNRIINLHYLPGFKLSESRLATEFNLGRSPIRSAFARLHNEGWIEVSPQSGTYVRKLSEQEIAEIFEYRLILEVNAARLAAKNISATRINQLRKSFNKLKPKGTNKTSPEKIIHSFNELDSLLHAEIYLAAGNSLITKTLFGLLDKVRWLKRLAPPTQQRLHELFSELEHIVLALEKRSSRDSARYMRQHIDNAADFGADLRASHSKHCKK